MRVNNQAQIPLPGTCWQPKGCLFRALLPGISRWQYIDAALATSATGRFGSLKSWIVQSVTVQPLSHFFITFWNDATRINSLGIEWDVEVEGALAEAAKRLNTTLKDKVSIIALLRAYPVPR